MKNKAEVKKALIQIWEDVKPYRWEYLFGGIMVFLFYIQRCTMIFLQPTVTD